MTDQAPNEMADAQHDPKVEADRKLIVDAKAKGKAATAGAYIKLSGPGWLQSAITLGGGSLAGSLYLGVIGGYQMLWLQPIMMILGIVMLSAIAYVTLSTGQKPFGAINQHVSPVLGWGWLIAAMLANLVWAMPQFSLGTAALGQNLAPDIFGGGGKYLAVALLFIIGSVVVWCYDSGGWGVKAFEIILKIMVAVVVLSFFGVVATMAFKGDGLGWGAIFSGFIPDFSLLSEPADEFKTLLSQTDHADYWREKILGTQRDRMVTAAATAVGINMTFLLPYSMLRKGWNKDFTGLATFDLSTGLFIPFILATSCVVIASASQFHGKYDLGLLGEGERTKSTLSLLGNYEKNTYGLVKKIKKDQAGKDADAEAIKKVIKGLEEGQKAHDKKVADALNALKGRNKDDKSAALKARLADPDLGLGLGPMDAEAAKLKTIDKKLAAMLVPRDAFILADSLENLTGKGVSQFVFGIGVVGMAISTIIILMLINGFCLTEMLGAPSRGTVHRIGSILPGITGALGFLLLWVHNDVKFWLAVPTSVFGMVLLPIAYITFFFMMNSKSLLGEHLPKGNKRIALNLIMVLAIVAASIGAGWSIWAKAGWVGVGGVAIFVALTLAIRPTSNRKTHPD